MVSIRKADKQTQTKARDDIFDAMANLYMNKSDLEQLKLGKYSKGYLLEQIDEAIEEAVWSLGYDLDILASDSDFDWVYTHMNKYMEEFLDSHGVFDDKVRDFYIHDHSSKDTLRTHKTVTPKEKGFPRVNVRKMF